MRLVKSITTRDFEVALYELENGWKILFESPGEKGESDVLEHLNVANYLFDIKVKDLEGN